MADIRKNPIPLEVFASLAVEDPISAGGRWARTDSVWSSGLRVRHPDVVLSTANRFFGSSYFTPENWDGDDAENWAYCTGGNASGIHWATGLVQQPGGSGAIDGYEFREIVTSGGPGYQFYKITNGSYSLLSSGGGAGLTSGPHYQLIRRNGSAVEGWIALDLDAWNLLVSVTDTTYTTDLHAYLALADNSGSYIHGFEIFGGGPTKYRFIPQVYRRTVGVA